MNNTNFQIMLEAVLDKVKSIANIKSDIKEIESKLPIKLQGTLNKTETRKELSAKLKTIKPKVKIDADTTQAEKKIKKIEKQKTDITITPKVDNKQVMSELKQTQKETKNLFERFSNGIVGINLVRMSFQHITWAIKEAKAAIKELDAIKTNIQMVSGTSDLDANAMMSSYNKMAKGLSSTTKDVAEAANEFLRMGESVSDTNELIKSSQVLSKIGMIESSNAANYLISSLKGYKVAAEDSMDVVSKLTAVDLEAAVSAGGLAEAISKCSNIANNSGVSMNRLIGYTATVGEVTQKSMSEVGNSFQSLLSRMNNIKIGKFIDDETGESLSDTEAVLNKLGIELRDTENSYRSFDDVLDNIGNRWKDFTKVEQNAISVAIAGTRQRENFESLMNNWKNALKYSETAANSAGSALERYGVYQDSIEAKTNKLTVAIESLSTNTISEELYSDIIEATTGIVEFIDKTNILKGTLAGFVAMGVSKAFVSMSVGITTAYKSTAKLTEVMALFDKGTSVDNLKKIGQASKGLSDQQLKLVLSTNGLTTAQRLIVLEGKGVVESERKQTLTALGLAAAEDKTTISTFSLKGAFKSLWAVVAMNPIGVIVTAASVATMVFSGFNHAIEEIRQKAKDLGNAFSDTKADIEDYKSKIEELHNTINDSSSSLSDVITARKNLMSVQDELIKKYGTEKGAINDITDAINGQADAFDRLTKKQWQETRNGFNNTGFWSGIANWIEGYDTNIDRMIDKMENVREVLSYSYDDYQNVEYLELKRQLESIGWAYDYSLGGFVKEGNLKELYNEILKVQNLIDDYEAPQKLIDDLTNDANKAKETIDSYNDMWDAYILQDRIFEDNDLANSWHEINDAYSDYQKAFTSGNEERIVKAQEDFAKTLMDATNSLDDQSVIEYFNNMYPDLQEVVGQWQFDIAFHANTDNLREELQTNLFVLSRFTSSDLLNFNTAMATDEQVDAYKQLQNIANRYKIEFEEFVKFLQTMGILQYDFAPLPTSINSQYDQKQLQNSQEKIDYYNSLDDETRSLIINSEIPYEVKQGTLEDFKSFLGELEEEAKINIDIQPIDIASPLSDIKSAYSSFESIFNEIESGATVSASSINELSEKFGELNGGKSLEQFKDVLTTMPDDVGACKEALNQLATDYLDQSELIQNLTADNAEYTESELRKLGVENAHEVVQSRLIQHNYSEADAKAVLVNYANQLTDAKERERIASIDLANATIEEIAELINEANAAGISTVALQSWLSQKVQANAITITTDGDIKNLISLVSALGSATTYIQKYNQAKQTLESGGTLTGNATADKYQLDALEKGAKKELQDALNGSKNANVNYTGGASSSGGGSGSGSGSGGSSSSETSKEYDWIAIGIQRCEESLKRLEKVESNTYTGWSRRNDALNKEISETAKEISLLQSSYDGYMKQADSIGLSDEYKQKVQNGTIEIESIEDEGLREQIDAYQKWYDEAVSVKDKIDDLNISLSQLAEKKFDNIVSQFEDIENVFTSLNDRIESSIDLAEAKGRLISKTYYEEMIKSETENNKLLKQQQEDMTRSLNEAVSSGSIIEGSEAWYEMQDKISDVNKAIIESDKSIQEFNNSIRELDWEIFDLIQDKITNIADEIGFMTSLLENETLTNGAIDRGLTEEGIAQLGNFASKYNIYMAQAEKYAEEIREIEADIARDPANQDLIKRKQDLVDAQQDVILSANEEKQAMFDLARDGYDAVLNALQELIDKRKDALDSEKELYEYQKSIAEKTKNIASIRKRLSVVENDDSEEAKKTIQQLRVELSEAEQDLKDTEYDKYISDQEKMLDDFYQDYSDKIDEKFEQLDILFQELIEIINQNSESINNTLSLTAEEVGYTMSKELTAIWGDTGTVISNFSGKFDTYSTTIQSVLSGIKTTVDGMLKIAQDEANAAIAATQPAPTPAPAPSAPATESSTSTSTQASTTPSTPNVGETISVASGRWYVDSYGSKAGSDVNKYAPDYFKIDKISSGRAYPYHIQAYKNGRASGGNGWVKGSQIGYKNGLKESMFDHMAWTQEEGGEMIRTPDGALLTPIPKGTSVFTRDMTNNLWDFAVDPQEFMKELYKVPEVSVNNGNGGNVEINIENMALPNVTKPEEFCDNLVSAMQNNNRVVKAMRSLTVDSLAGYNSKRINRF